MIGLLPLATTALAALLARALLLRWRRRRSAHLLWWAIGTVCYGIGTALEGAITLAGSSVGLVRAWYVAGALLGAWPLAQGTAYLLFPRRVARALAVVALPVVLAGAALALLSPADASRLEPRRPTAAILMWPAAHACAPWINAYAALLLVGGAAWSAVRFARTREGRGRALGNALIAGGALLPAIGGGIARHGGVEVLYVTELVGLAAIALGYAACLASPAAPAAEHGSTSSA